MFWLLSAGGAGDSEAAGAGAASAGVTVSLFSGNECKPRLEKSISSFFLKKFCKRTPLIYFRKCREISCCFLKLRGCAGSRRASLKLDDEAFSFNEVRKNWYLVFKIL